VPAYFTSSFSSYSSFLCFFFFVPPKGELASKEEGTKREERNNPPSEDEKSEIKLSTNEVECRYRGLFRFSFLYSSFLSLFPLLLPFLVIPLEEKMLCIFQGRHFVSSKEREKGGTKGGISKKGRRH